jgi:hypothetical protein
MESMIWSEISLKKQRNGLRSIPQRFWSKAAKKYRASFALNYLWELIYLRAILKQVDHDLLRNFEYLCMSV